MSRWIKVYDRETRELVFKEEYERRIAARAKPCSYELPANIVRGHWKYDRATRTFIPITQAPKLEAAAPFIQTEEIPPTMSHATDEGLMFTSKKKLLEHYAAHGMAVREKGMCAKQPEPYKADPKEIRETAAKALNDLRWGNVPLSEAEKERCRREQRALQEYKKRMH